ncbi:MAG: lysylphosphatidylglycerol synthase domain-containing protein [Candidatus Sumerlaeota bacterium]
MAEPIMDTRVRSTTIMVYMNRLFGLIPFILLIVAIVILRREFAAIEWSDISRTIHEVDATSLIGTVICIVLCYTASASSDWMGVRHVGSDMPLRQIIKTAVLARCFSNTIGVSVLSGGAIRYRYYTNAGLSPLKIGRVILIYSFGCAVGLITIAGIAFVLYPQDISVPHFTSSRPLGFALLATSAVYLIYTFIIKKPIRIGRIIITPFEPRLAAPHLPFAMFDWLAGALGLYFILPLLPEFSVQTIITTYFLAIIVGHVSGVPSAIGVFEAAIIILLGGENIKGTLLPWLILYRLIFYLIPFCMAFIYVAMTVSGGIRGLLNKEKPPP